MTIKLPPQRPYVLLPSGNILDLADPDPASWTNEDLAIGLSRTYRWGGHSGWPRPLSVAQHSLSVLAIAEGADNDLGPQRALYELLHDAEEGLIGFDCIAPMKQLLGEPFRALCERLTAAVAERYNLPVMTTDQYVEHKRADRLAAASEALHVARWSPEQIRDTLLITETPLQHDPLRTSMDGSLPYADWEPWPARVAARAWLAELEDQLRAAGTESGR